MSETNKAVARRFYEAINGGNVDIVDQVIADNFVEHDQFAGLPPSKEGVRAFFTMFRQAFPDFEMTMEDMVAEGDKIFIRAVMRGTHRGEFMGIPPTGKRIDVPVADIVRFEGERVVEHWGVTDTGIMLQQLGVIELPG